MSSNSALANSIKKQILEKQQKLLDEGLIRSDEQIKKGYTDFQQYFNYDVLQKLTGEELLEFLFNVSNKESLAYWLEYKNDEHFDTMQYGSIAGGSALKYIIYKRKADQRWVTGSAQNELETGVAIRQGEEIRDAMLRGADFIRKDLQVSDQSGYMHLQKLLDEHDIGQYGWIHKYYHMLYPDRIFPYHSMRYQKHTLFCLNTKPTGDQLYLLTGQITQLFSGFNLQLCQIMRALVALYGPPVNYYRIGTTEGGTGKSMWNDMIGKGCAAIGWSELGDLRKYGPMGESDTKNKITIEFERLYTKNKKVIGRQVNEIFRFYSGIKERDIVVACNGQTILGIGEVTGDYKFDDTLAFSHTRNVTWRILNPEKLPVPKEGLQSAVRQLKDDDNILAIRRMLENARDPKPGEPPSSDPTRPPFRSPQPLDNDILRVKGILERKNQIILYGPPGTGKTYLAEKATRELASREHFNKEYDALSQTEKDKLNGNGRKNGFVRFCCFHSSYGYEDFIEGIKPNVVNGHTLFELRDGIFKKLCDDANEDRNHNYYLIVDEINRGDVSRIFGELIMLLEKNKRDKKITLPISGVPFSVPPNVYIIGTMNTADRSIALLDIALRRRFGFMELMPDYELLKNVNVRTLPVGQWLLRLNQRICTHLGKDGKNLQIGHSYFMGSNVSQYDIFRDVLAEDILPLVEEYCYGDYEKIAAILGNSFVDTDKKMMRNQFLISSEANEVIKALLSKDPGVELNSADDFDDEETGSGKDEDEDEDNIPRNESDETK